MKLIKIRFTSWRDESFAPRSLALQAQLDALTTRISVLTAAAARIKHQRWPYGEAQQKELTAANAEMQEVHAERARLLSGEADAAKAEARSARAHKKVGTFGYQLLHPARTHIAMVVDEAGDYLPVQAVYSYEVVDENPPLPEWAKRKFGGIE